MILTTDPELITMPDYQRISSMIFRLYQSGVCQMGQGWCLSMSDMIYTLLKQQGISSRLVECQLVITDTTDPSSPQYRTVGVDLNHIDGAASTHVVVVTATDPPMIIDSSIGHMLPNQGVIVDTCLRNPGPDRVFCDCVTGDLRITYTEKLTPKLPISHQQSVIDRIVTDQKIFSEIRLLKILNYVGITLSMFAAINVIGKLLGIL